MPKPGALTDWLLLWTEPLLQLDWLSTCAHAVPAACSGGALRCWVSPLRLALVAVLTQGCSAVEWYGGRCAGLGGKYVDSDDTSVVCRG